MICASRLVWVLILISSSLLAVEGAFEGRVNDSSGAAVPGAAVSLSNPLTGYRREAISDAQGKFVFLGVPLNQYHVTIGKDGFADFETDIEARGRVPVHLEVKLELAGTATAIQVEAFGQDILENVPYAHSDAGRRAIEKLPLAAPASSLSDAITMFAPGVVADSNGFFHPLGDHAQAGMVIDGQPVTDQQSKQFSTQIPANALEAMELINGGANAEFGDKTSLVINAQTRSGLDMRPHGRFAAHYGSFGTLGEDFSLGLGSKRFGNFLVANMVRSGRFLDTPEFRPQHAVGNNGVIFDRIDFRPNDRHAFHLNLFGARNWFQIPTTLDQPNQDQRQETTTFSANGGYAHTASARAVWNLNTWVRQDRIGYYPSRNVLDDTPATISQNRHLTNYGARSDASWANGTHNLKAGLLITQTRLKEHFMLGITDPELAGDDETLQQYVIAAGGRPFSFHGLGNVNQIAWYGQDTIRLGNFTVNAGLRFDHYDGPSHANTFQPRLGVSYHVRPTGTVLRGSYSYSLETPYNENLLLSSATGQGGLSGAGLGGIPTPIQPGKRHQTNAGIQQALGRYAQIDADYFWKDTTNAFDFGALFDTSIFFPLSMPKSKIDGVAVRVSTSNWRGFQAYTLMGHSRARFTGPANGGLLFNDDVEEGTFRIDHDQKFQQTTFARYQYKNGPWLGFTWRYDSGMVAGAAEDEDEILALSGARQAAMGLYCGDVFATPSAPITSCGGALQATRIRIPAPGTADPDHNPPRIAPRHLFNLSVGTDSLWKSERFNTTLRFTVVNVTNRVALYNFLSTFAGTHFVAPRSYIAEIGFRF